MADPVASAAASAALPPPSTAAPDPKLAAMFAGHMRGEPAASASADTGQAVAAVEDMAARLFQTSGENHAGLLNGLERSVLTTATPGDFLRATLAASDVTMHVSMSLMKIHLSTSLGSAATSLFGTLLRNRE